MALTVDALRAKLESLNKRGGGGNKGLWKPQDNHQVRVLPLDGEEPYRVAMFHYINNKSIYCPQSTGEHCVICEYAEAMKSWNNPDGSEKPEDVRKKDFEVFKKVQAGTKYYFAIVERERDEKGKLTGKSGDPKWWPVSESNFKKLIEIAVNPELNEMTQEQGGGEGFDVMTNLKVAVDLTVDLKKANNKDGKGNGKQFPVTDIDRTMRLTPLSKDKDEVKKILESIPKFEDAVQPKTVAEVQKFWDEYMSAGGDPDTQTEGLDKTPSNSAEGPATGKQSVDDAITKLLGD